MITAGRCGVALAVGVVLVAGGSAWAADFTPVLEGPDRQPVPWAQWLDANAPAAVLVWSSWAPGSKAALADLDELAAACRAAGLELLIVAVQEPFEDARGPLEPRAVAWAHDRHGSLLKLLRVLHVPSLVVVERGGDVVARLEPSPQGVRSWSRR